MAGTRISSPSDALYIGLGTHYISSGTLISLKDALLAFNFSDNPDKDVQTLLAARRKELESESQLKILLPHIISSFGANRSVSGIVEELKRQQLSSDPTVAEWASDALLGIGKGAPFSLCLTEKHFSQVASTRGISTHHLAKLSDVMKMEYRIALRSSVRNDFSEGVRAVLVDRDQTPKWSPSRLEDIDMAEVESLFGPLPSGDELDV